MQHATLCLLLRNNEILLAMKKRGFGAGRWNGIGGKPEKGESIEEAAIRELKEEIDVVVSLGDLESVGEMDFYFRNKEEWDQHPQGELGAQPHPIPPVAEERGVCSPMTAMGCHAPSGGIPALAARRSTLPTCISLPFLAPRSRSFLCEPINLFDRLFAVNYS